MRSIPTTVLLATICLHSWTDGKVPAENDPMKAEVTDKVYMDISIGDLNVGRVVIGLFGKVVPKTVANFKELSRRPPKQGYKGSQFHRVSKDFMVQAGDYHGSGGTYSESAAGGLFPDENFRLQHTTAGTVSMANKGKDTNGSQFFITLVPTPWLDGKHVLFGRVLEGMHIVKMMENVPVNQANIPSKRITITDCGLLNNVTEL